MIINSAILRKLVKEEIENVSEGLGDDIKKWMSSVAKGGSQAQNAEKDAGRKGVALGDFVEKLKAKEEKEGKQGVDINAFLQKQDAKDVEKTYKTFEKLGASESEKNIATDFDRERGVRVVGPQGMTAGGKKLYDLPESVEGVNEEKDHEPDMSSLLSWNSEIKAARDMSNLERGQEKTRDMAEYEDPTYDGTASLVNVIDPSTDPDTFMEAISRSGLSPEEMSELDAFESGYVGAGELSPAVAQRVNAPAVSRPTPAKGPQRPSAPRPPPRGPIGKKSLAGQKCNGFDKPNYKGTAVGQVAGVWEPRVPTGRFIFIPDPENPARKIRVPVKAKITWHSWEWNGTDWAANPFDETTLATKMAAKKW